MGKRHPNMPAWQWRSNPQSNASASHQAIDLMAVALMVVAFLLLASGIFSGNATSAVIGLVQPAVQAVVCDLGQALVTGVDLCLQVVKDFALCPVVGAARQLVLIEHVDRLGEQSGLHQRVALGFADAG